MSVTELTHYYQTRKATFENALTDVKKKINVISNFRILLALLFLVCVYFAFNNNNEILFFIAAFWAAVFVYLIIAHGSFYNEKTHLENLIKINDQELKALLGNFSGLNEGGAFIDPHHPYTHDLDIYGEGSLFQSINRCSTVHGQQLMAQRLAYPLTSQQEISDTQDAILELSEKTDFRQHFHAAGMEVDEHRHDRDQLLEWMKLPSLLYKSVFYKNLLLILPILTITALVATFLIDRVKIVAVFLVLSQWIILGWHSKKINAFHEYISSKKLILEKYARLLHFFRKENFSSRILKANSDLARDADTKVKRLAALVSYLNARLNFLTNLIINSLLLYDLQCVYRLEKWKDENAVHLEDWLNVVSETEVLSSLGTFAFNHSSFTYPKINTELVVAATGLGHPLLPEEECVTNDLYLGKGQSVLIITGANMAGKSTFLRTVGVNLVLALAGAPVYAKTFSCPIIHLRSGMRTADSLKDHQSYFYAELDRLKTIMDELRSDKPLLILLDEILKGTNSTDKQSGSIALVKQLVTHPCLAMIATHDIVLSDLENQFPQSIKNYFFEANIENDQLSFDYKLKQGVAQKMNATFLMKKMGIIPRV